MAKINRNRSGGRRRRRARGSRCRMGGAPPAVPPLGAAVLPFGLWGLKSFYSGSRKSQKDLRKIKKAARRSTRALRRMI